MGFETYDPKDETTEQKNLTEESEQLSLNQVARNDIDKIENSLNEIAKKLPDDFFDDKDAEIWNNKTDKLKDAIRDGIGESYGLNFTSEFLELPEEGAEIESKEDLKELWYDIVGSIDYAWSQAGNDDWLSDEAMSELEDLAESMETNTRKLLTQVDFADPDALAYGMKRVSSRTRNFLWRQIKNKAQD